MPTWAIYLAGSAPAAHLFYAALTNQLGADPIDALENALGEWALWLLIASLVVTPLQRLARINLVKYRRAIGLLAFVYVTLHFGVYILLDRQMDWSDIWTDVWKRPYITIGLTSFLLLLPLAITSNNWSLRKLGTQTWRRLHSLVYLAAPLAALHYLLLVKAWPLEPIIYLTILVLLVVIRILWGSFCRRLFAKLSW